MEDNKITVLGIDQGLANIGYCVMRTYKDLLDEPVILESNTFITKSDDSLENRLGFIYDKLLSIIDKYPEISFIGCERLFYSGMRSSSILTTNLVTGIIFLLANKTNKQVRDYPATSVKKIMTGDGKAKKDDIANAINHICAINDILSKDRTDHENDSIAIAYTTIKDFYLNGDKHNNISKRTHKNSKILCETTNNFLENLEEVVFKDNNIPIQKNKGLTISNYIDKPRKGHLMDIKSKSKQYEKYFGFEFAIICYVNDDFAEQVELTTIDEIKNAKYVDIDVSGLKIYKIENQCIYLLRKKSILYIIKGNNLEDKIDKIIKFKQIFEV